MDETVWEIRVFSDVPFSLQSILFLPGPKLLSLIAALSAGFAELDIKRNFLAESTLLGGKKYR